ncbi:hypothetical protein [Dickeya fangzhongdai]|uniref:hypothetical protein n=1 Tax=Dickeya fangzhongdai TaxID=1778540 RepID=UPI0026E01FC1|nr:hypothetical protein [Dickeya fangzhongdai]WKV50672.1 hypothetical protein PL145_23125 [Dickeya fangzhongdai]
MANIEQYQHFWSMSAALSLSQVNATSSDGRCAPYCLTSFFELLHSTINSHHADVLSAFFLPAILAGGLLERMPVDAGILYEHPFLSEKTA